MPMKIEGAKIACLDFSLQKSKMHLGVSVVVTDPEKLDAIRQRWAESIHYLWSWSIDYSMGGVNGFFDGRSQYILIWAESIYSYMGGVNIFLYGRSQ